jgi:hypothetical protein
MSDPSPARLPWSLRSRTQTRPQQVMSLAKEGESERVTTVNSDAFELHLLDLDNPAHCNTVQIATGYAEVSAPAAASPGDLPKSKKIYLKSLS